MKRNDLLKLASIAVLVSILLSWVVGSSSFSGSEVVTGEISRIGLFDVATYSMLQLYYFPAMFIFIFIVGGFYNFLGKTQAYRSLVAKIAKTFEKRKVLLVAISMVVFACLSGVVNDYVLLIALIPFVISVLSSLKVDKITGFAATFGGVMVGILGSTYSQKVAGVLAESSNGINVGYGYELVATIIVFVISLLVLLGFTIERLMRIEKKGIECPLLEDMFMSLELKTDKKVVVKTMPLVVTLIVSAVILVLAFIGWTSAFNVNVFENIYNWIKEATLFDHTVFAYVLGSGFVSFGNWDLFSAAVVLMIASLIIKVLYRISFDDVVAAYGEGFKKVGKTVIVLVAVYTVLVLNYFHPVVPFFIGKLTSLVGTNVYSVFASSLLASIFNVDLQFTANQIGSFIANFSNVKVAAFALQTAYGLVSFITPTSAILMIGLSMLNVKFKEYLSFIWKFLLPMLVVIIIILSVLMYA